MLLLSYRPGGHHRDRVSRSFSPFIFVFLSRVPPSVQCEKCKKNEAKYGKPAICKYCQLPAAFHQGKCVYCAHSERRTGEPLPCAHCKLKAYFDAKGKVSLFPPRPINSSLLIETARPLSDVYQLGPCTEDPNNVRSESSRVRGAALPSQG